MYGAIGVGCVLVLLVIVVILVIRRKLRTMNRRHTGPADETKYVHTHTHTVSHTLHRIIYGRHTFVLFVS